MRICRPILLLGAWLCLPLLGGGQDKENSPNQPGKEKEPIETLMPRWEKEIRAQLDKDPKLMVLAAKYQFVLLHSRFYYAGGPYKWSAYSFNYQSNDKAKHHNDVQLVLHGPLGEDEPNVFDINHDVEQQNLVVDLGEVDFEMDPDPAKISIDQQGVSGKGGRAVEGHVYLELIRDERGNYFYVVFQIVAADKASRYIAFLWRKLPGGQVVTIYGKAIEKMMVEWKKDIQVQVEKDPKLKALAAKYPLVVLHSRYFYGGDGGYGRSAYSFIHESSETGNYQILFHNGGYPNSFELNSSNSQINLVVDLGQVDFADDPDPAKIFIDRPGVISRGGKAIEGHVYLERVRDDRGNNFYALFQVVTVDKGSRYMAFLWRKLPGGKVVKW